MRTRFDVRMPRIKNEGICPIDERADHIAAVKLSREPLITPVTPRSPKAHRRAVYELAGLFKREMRFDFTQYPHPDDDPGPETTRAYLWVSRDWWPEEIVFGACCFGWTEWKNVPACWSLDWAWIHWVERRSGHFAKAWPFFRARFGDFHLGHPISLAMESFLRKHNAGSKWEKDWNYAPELAKS